MGFELIALLCAALFAGASIYVSVVEHPARMGAGVGVALAEWRPSYRCAALMQSILAVLGFLAAVVAYAAAGRGLPALAGGLFLISVAPWTVIVIMPTNRQLLDPARRAEAPDTATLLEPWGRLHAVRTVAGVVATAVLAPAIAGYL
jgi:uncharacterized membrane protein